MNSQTQPTFSDPQLNAELENRNYRYGDFSAHDSIILACKLIINDQINFINLMTPVAVEGTDKEGVHKMRVGFRRIRTCLQIIKPFIKNKLYRYLQNNAKAAGQLLGQLRDLDVLFINLNERYPSQNSKAEENIDPIINELNLKERYANSKHAFLSYISSSNYASFVSNLKVFCHEPNNGIKNKTRSAEDHPTIKTILPPKLLTLYGKVENYTYRFESPQPYHIYHSFRKDNKKLRYTLEFFSSLLEVKSFESLVNELVEIQDYLGYLNDCVVACNVIESQNRLSDLDPKQAAIEHIENYLHIRRSEKDRFIEEITDIWIRFQSNQPSRLLNQSLAPLIG